ncbi:serpin family protein [Myxococcota bacterium]|nr:serpin family protein [Myxococcota bacterium]
MLLALALALPLGCSPDPGDSGGPDGGTDGGTADLLPPPGEAVASDLARDTDPDVDTATLLAHTASMRAFAVDLLHRSAAEENLFLSPYSISVALAMTWAGTNGATEAQLTSALHFDLPEDQLHPAFNALDLALAGRADEVPVPETGDPGDAFALSLVNQLFGQAGYPFQAPFLDTLALHYGAGMRLLDFQADPEDCRGQINAWVEAVTQERIEDLLPPGSITDLTRLVLVNAIYFKASWWAPFEASATTDQAFTTLSGAEVSVPTMHGELETRYGAADGLAVVDLPYVGEQLTMTLVVPDAGRFTDVRDGLDAATLDEILASLSVYRVTLAVPRFSFRTALDVIPPLRELGVVDAFDPELADLSGMSTASELYVSGVFHQAFVAVDEAGTEAAAATAVVVGDESEPPHAELIVDRPFLFLIRDRPTGAVLFLGQVVDPG